MIPWNSHRATAHHRVNILLLSLGGLLVFSSPGEAEDPLPKALPTTKYAKMAAHSPFAPPTAPAAVQAAPTPPPAPGWADSLTATMIMQDGAKYIVTVVDSQNPQHLYLTTEPGPTDPMSVASVKWGANREDAPVVTLRKGRETAQVRYEAGATSAGGANALGGGPPIPGAARGPVAGSAAAPGAQTFHPPPLPNSVQANGGPSTAIRRPLIRASQPSPGAQAPAGIRPGVNPGGVGARPNPAVQVDDDDDD